jgi:hypothetical protein
MLLLLLLLLLLLWLCARSPLVLHHPASEYFCQLLPGRQALTLMARKRTSVHSRAIRAKVCLICWQGTRAAAWSCFQCSSASSSSPVWHTWSDSTCRFSHKRVGLGWLDVMQRISHDEVAPLNNMPSRGVCSAALNRSM